MLIFDKKLIIYFRSVFGIRKMFYTNEPLNSPQYFVVILFIVKYRVLAMTLYQHNWLHGVTSYVPFILLSLFRSLFLSPKISFPPNFKLYPSILHNRSVELVFLLGRHRSLGRCASQSFFRIFNTRNVTFFVYGPLDCGEY